MEQSNGNASVQETAEQGASTFRDIAETNVPAIRFEALEPRVLLSGDVNPSAISISGTLDQPGQQNHYQFTVQDTHRVVFDSLTNRADLEWTLTNSAGQQIASQYFNSDTGSSVPAFDLAPGTYTLTVDGVADAVGGYALRIIDAAAAVSLTPDTAVHDTLAQGNETAVYRFDATAGQKLYFSHAGVTGGSATWQLLDPYGRLEGGSYDMNSDRDTFIVQRTGEYLLMVEGQAGNSSPVDYGFTLANVVDTTQALTLDSTTTAHIGSAGATANFTFTLDDTTSLLLDRLSNANFYWSLSGPRGQEVARTGLGETSGTAVLSGLPKGDYTLSIDPNGATTGDFAFRLLTSASTQALATDQATSGTLDQPCGTRLYRVDLAAGEKLSLGGTVTGGSASWRLVDPYGATTTHGSLNNVPTVFTASAGGTYWLAVGGADSNAADATVGYQFTLHQVPDLAQLLTLGAPVSGNIALPGQDQVYTFSLAAATQLAFTSLSSRSDVNWSLTGPSGKLVDQRTFAQGDGNALVAPAGDYTLRVSSQNGATGAFGFFLQDLAQAAAVTVGDEISGSVGPDQPSVAYRFSADAGDQVDLSSLSSTASGTWRIIDLYGRTVASGALKSGATGIHLSVTGTYTLQISAVTPAATTSTYDLKLVAKGNTAPAPLPDGDALTFGAAVAGTVASGTSKVYRFSLTQDQFLLMDSLIYNTNVEWSLIGPRGTEVSARELEYSDGRYGNASIRLVAGDYALTLNGSVNYNFRILDPAQATALTLGQQVSATRSPSNSTLSYQFNGTAGTEVYFQASNTNDYRADWRLYDPYGQQLQIGSDNLTYHLAATGRYTLINEGEMDLTGSASFSFSILPKTTTQQTAALNQVYAGELASGQMTQYSFHLDAAQLVDFDALQSLSSSAQWSLAGPAGSGFGWLNAFSGGEGIPNARWLREGDYVLSVRNLSTGTANYQFQLQNADSAVGAQIGTPLTLDAAASHDTLLRLDLSANDQLYWTSDTYYSTYTLIDGYGKQVSSGYLTNSQSVQAPTTGTYFLVLGKHSSSLALDFGIKRNLVAPFTLGSTVTGELAQPGDTVNYTFTLAQATLLSFNSTVSSGNPYWTLVGPRGTEGSTSLGSGYEPYIMALPAGTYTLSISSYYLSTANYSFTLSDLAQAPALPSLDAMVTATLPPNTVQAFQFDVAEAGQFAFDAPAYQECDWRVIDSTGKQVASSYVDTMESPFTLAAGHYVLMFDHNYPGSNFSFALRTIKTLNAPLPLDAAVDTQVDRIGDRLSYHFSVDTPTRVVLESLADRDDMSWTLTGPTGTIGSGTLQAQAGGHLLDLVAAGDYTLTITPQADATGAIKFRLDAFADATALALGTAQSFTAAANDGTTLYRVDGQAGQYLTLDVGSLAGTAKLWIRDMHGNLIVTDTALAADTSYGFALPQDGSYLVGLRTDDDETAQLTATASLVSPASQSLAVGGIVTGSLDHVGVPSEFSIDAPVTRRLLLQEVQGTTAGWSIVDGSGTVVAQGSSARPVAVVLQPGTYHLYVTAGDKSQLGDFTLRVLDLDAAPVLDPNGTVSGQLQGPDDLAVYRVAADAPDAKLSLSGTAGAPVSLTVLDAAGTMQGSYTLPAGAVVLANGVSKGTERIVLVSGASTATDYSLTSTEQTQTDPGDALSLGTAITGTLAQVGNYASFPVVVAFDQKLTLADLMQDIGSTGTSWEWLRASDGTAVDPTAVPDAGDYILKISATADNAHYAFDLLDSADAPPLGAAGCDSTLAADKRAFAYACNLPKSGIPDLTVSGIDASQFSWQIFDANGESVAQGLDASHPDMQVLPAGQYTLVLCATAADAVGTFHVGLALPPPALIPLEGDINGDLVANASNVYRLHVPAGTTVQIHDLGSDTSAQWTLTNAYGSYELSGNSTLDATFEQASWLSAGDYLLTVSTSVQDAPEQAGRLSVSAAAHFDLQVLDLGQAAVLPPGGATGSFDEAGREVAYRVSAASGQRLAFALQGDSSLAWTLLDDDGNQVGSGDSSASSEALEDGDYTLLVMAADRQATDLSYTLGMAVAQPVTADANTIITGTFDSSGHASYRMNLDQDQPVELINVQADDIRLSQWGDEFDVSNRPAYLEEGPCDIDLFGTAGTDFSFELAALKSVPAITDTGEVSLEAGQEAAVYRFSTQDEFGTVDVAPTDTVDLEYTVYDQDGDEVWSDSAGNLGHLPSAGDYYLLIERLESPIDTVVASMVTLGTQVSAVTLGATTTVDADASDYGEAYTFTVPSETLFQPLLGGDVPQWQDYSITDDAGNVVASGQLRYLAPVLLEAGNYRFTVMSRYSGGGEEAFSASSTEDASDTWTIQWMDLGQATVLSTDAPVAASWTSTDNQQSAYRLSVAAGDALSLQFTPDADAGNGYVEWDMFDSQGHFLGYGSSDYDGAIPAIPFTASTDVYVIVNGYRYNSEVPVTYSGTFEASLDHEDPVPVTPVTPYTLGQTVNTQLPASGSCAYGFSLAKTGSLFLNLADGWNDGDDFGWRLRLGDTIVAAGNVSADGIKVINDLAACDYVLEAFNRNTGGSESGYNDLRLFISDTASVPALDASDDASADAPVVQTTLAAGTACYFDPDDWGTWDVYRPDLSFFGTIVVGNINNGGEEAEAFASLDNGTAGPDFIADASGTWYFASSAGVPSFLASTPMQMGSEVTGTVSAGNESSPGSSDYYSFHLDSDQLVDLYLGADASQGTSPDVELSLGHDGQWTSVEPGLLSLEAGDYQLRVDGADSGDSEACRLELKDPATDAPVLTDGSAPTVMPLGDLETDGSDVFAIDANAGDTYGFVPGDNLQGSEVYWALFDATGTIVEQGGADGLQAIRFAQTGRYYLQFANFDSDVALNDGSTPLTFQWLRAPGESSSLDRGDETVLAASATPVLKQYSVTLAADSSLVFSGSSVSGLWSLSDGAATDDWYGPIEPGYPMSLGIEPGTYILSVWAFTDDGSDASLNIQVEDLSNAPALALDQTASIQVGPAQTSVYYRVTLAAPDFVSLDALASTSGISAYAWLLGQDGQWHGTSLSDNGDPVALDAGSYLLEIDANSTDGAAHTLPFRLLGMAQLPDLALGAMTTLDTDQGAVPSYHVHIDEPTSLALDASGANGSWELTGTDGEVFSGTLGNVQVKAVPRAITCCRSLLRIATRVKAISISAWWTSRRKHPSSSGKRWRTRSHREPATSMDWTEPRAKPSTSCRRRAAAPGHGNCSMPRAIPWGSPRTATPGNSPRH